MTIMMTIWMYWRIALFVALIGADLYRVHVYVLFPSSFQTMKHERKSICTSAAREQCTSIIKLIVLDF